MVDDKPLRPPDMTFAIHIWQDIDEAWRGRVVVRETSIGYERSTAFLDAHTLFEFMRDCLEAQHVSLPRRGARE